MVLTRSARHLAGRRVTPTRYARHPRRQPARQPPRRAGSSLPPARRRPSSAPVCEAGQTAAARLNEAHPCCCYLPSSRQRRGESRRQHEDGAAPGDPEQHRGGRGDRRGAPLSRLVHGYHVHSSAEAALCPPPVVAERAMEGGRRTAAAPRPTPRRPLKWQRAQGAREGPRGAKASGGGRTPPRRRAARPPALSAAQSQNHALPLRRRRFRPSPRQLARLVCADRSNERYPHRRSLVSGSQSLA